MMSYLPRDLITHLILFQLVVLLVLLSNIVLLHRTRRHAPPVNFPLVSILIPARNEERNIASCVRSLLAQEYPFFEVLVLDDQSSDNTPTILRELARSNPRLKILAGLPPRDDQAGKNWACSQLAGEAQGDLLFFTDADTTHQPETLRAIVTALQGERADLVTGFPRQQVLSWGERLLVPFFTWASLSFVPLWLAYRFRTQALSVAVGQVMLFRREAYQVVGGHAALGTVIVDDIQFARRVKAAGLRWRVVRVSDLITSRMYRGSREAADGFTKNLFAAFDFRLLIYLFVFLWLAVLFWVPLIALTSLLFIGAPTGLVHQLIICIGLSLLIWLIPYHEMGVPLYLGFLYPVTILANEAVAFQSLLYSLTGRLAWKDRPLARPKWKWL